MSINRGIDKDVVLIFNGKLLSHKKEWNNGICSNMDGLTDYHARWSKSEREKQILYDISMWNLKKMTHMNLSVKQKQIHSHREQTCGCQWGGAVRGKDWEFGMSRCKLLFIGWINNKVLLYNTGNYIQYPVINCHGEEYEKEYVYV